MATLNTALPMDFKRWLQARQLGHVRQGRIDTYVRAQGGGPALLLVINDLGNDEQRLLQTLHSIDRQAPLLANATVVVLSSRPGVGTGQVEEGFYWISSSHAQRAGHLNQLVSELNFEWFFTLDAGTVINADALSVTLLELLGKPACPAIFCDEAYSDGRGGLWPLLRGNFNLDQLLSVPVAMAGHWLFQRDALVAMDGFDGDVPAALELDLILRLIEAGQQGFGHISEPLVIPQTRPLVPCEDERRALLQHLQRRGYADARVSESSPRHYRLHYGHAPAPVAVLIPVQEPLATLKRCVAAVLMVTGYANYHLVLVETDRTTPALREWMDAMAGEGEGRVVAIRSAAPLPMNTAMNGAVEALSDEYVVFLDPACVVVEADWLELLLDQAMRPEVGAVGGRRVQRGERLQEVGVRLGLEGPAQTALLSHEEGPMDYWPVQRNVVALAGACLMLSRTIFRQVGGFDETRFQQHWADTDLCLKLHWAGYLNVWAPQAWLALTEPPRQPLVEATADEHAMYEQWGASLGRDPTASYLYTLRGDGFEFDSDPQVTWRPLAFAGLPVVIGGGEPGGSDPRIVQPLEALRYAGRLEGGLAPYTLKVSEWLRLVPGSVVLPFNAGSDLGLDAARGQIAPCRVCDLSAASDNDLQPEALRLALAGYDKVVVATPEQAERVAGAHPRIHVLPACLPPTLWRDLPLPSTSAGMPRVGLVCAQDESPDLEVLCALFERFAGRVQWVVVGEVPHELRPWVTEHQPIEAPRYAGQLAALGLHVAVVALAPSFGALAAAEQRTLEHAACGNAVIGSHASAWPIAKVQHSFEGYSAALEAWVSDPAGREAAGQALHARAMAEGLLEGPQAERWLAAWGPLIG